MNHEYGWSDKLSAATVHSSNKGEDQWILLEVGALIGHEKGGTIELEGHARWWNHDRENDWMTSAAATTCGAAGLNGS